MRESAAPASMWCSVATEAMKSNEASWKGKVRKSPRRYSTSEPAWRRARAMLYGSASMAVTWGDDGARLAGERAFTATDVERAPGTGGVAPSTSRW